MGRSRLLRVSNRRTHARVGDGHDDVGAGRRFARQNAAEVGADLVHAAAEDVAVRPREVDVLEHAVRERLRGKGLDRSQPAVADHEQLARLDVTHVGGAEQVERACLRADDPGIAEAAERERPEPVRIARGDQPVLGQQDERVRAADLSDGLGERFLDRGRPRARVQVQDDFGVAAGLKNRSVADELVAQLERVDEVAVVADGDLAVGAVDEERLRVLELALARGRVARVPDRDVPRKRLKRVLVERFGDLAHRPRDPELLAVGGGNAGALLPAVLKRVKAKVGEVGGLGVPEDSKNTALVFEWHGCTVDSTLPAPRNDGRVRVSTPAQLPPPRNRWTDGHQPSS